MKTMKKIFLSFLLFCFLNTNFLKLCIVTANKHLGLKELRNKDSNNASSTTLKLFHVAAMIEMRDHSIPSSAFKLFHVAAMIEMRDNCIPSSAFKLFTSSS